MKYFFLSMLCAVSINAIAQPSFHIGLKVCPEIDKRYVKIGNSPFGDNVDFSLITDNEKYRLGFTTGIVTSLKLNNLISIESGIFYTRKNYLTKAKLEPSEPDPIIPDEDINIISSYSYFQIPLGANLYFVNGEKLKLFLSSGITSNLFLSTSMKAKGLGKGENYSKDELNSLVWGYKGGFGVEITIKEKNTLRIEPVIEYWFTPLTSIYIKEYHHSYGFSLSYLFKMSKS